MLVAAGEPWESRPSVEGTGHTRGLRAGHASGITPDPAQGALVPGSQRWTTAGFGTEATLESEYTLNTWSIE